MPIKDFMNFPSAKKLIGVSIFVLLCCLLSFHVSMKYTHTTTTNIKSIHPKIVPWWVKEETVDERVKNDSDESGVLREENENLKTVLFWTKLFGKPWFKRWGRDVFKDCPKANNCFATNDSSLLTSADAVVIHFFDLSKSKMPESYHPRQRFVFVLIEPASHIFLKVKSLRGFNNYFNWTMTYRLDSDIPVPYGHIKKRLTPVDYHPNIAKRKSKFALWFVSRCPSKSRREEVAKELKKYIPIDVYGRNSNCNQSKCVDCNVNDMLDNQYKFYLAFENSLCKDYVTEKFFRNLKHDIIPVVFGGVNYSRVAPPNSFINVFDFSNLKKLADYLKMVAENDTLYNQYFEWRRNYEVSEGTRYNRWCRLCEKLNDPLEKPKTYGDLEKWWITDSHCKSFLHDKPRTTLADTFRVFRYHPQGIKDYG